jgi:hypothetical protein
MTQEEQETEREVSSQIMGRARVGVWVMVMSFAKLLAPVSIARALFEFMLPLVFAGYAVIVLLTSNLPTNSPNPVVDRGAPKTAPPSP